MSFFKRFRFSIRSSIAITIFFLFIENTSDHIWVEEEANLRNSPRPPPEKTDRFFWSSSFRVLKTAYETAWGRWLVYAKISSCIFTSKTDTFEPSFFHRSVTLSRWSWDTEWWWDNITDLSWNRSLTEFISPERWEPATGWEKITLFGKSKSFKGESRGQVVFGDTLFGLSREKVLKLDIEKQKNTVLY